jgi:hypothetical protein
MAFCTENSIALFSLQIPRWKLKGLPSPSRYTLGRPIGVGGRCGSASRCRGLGPLGRRCRRRGHAWSRYRAGVRCGAAVCPWVGAAQAARTLLMAPSTAPKILLGPRWAGSRAALVPGREPAGARVYGRGFEHGRDDAVHRGRPRGRARGAHRRGARAAGPLARQRGPEERAPRRPGAHHLLLHALPRDPARRHARGPGGRRPAVRDVPG